VHDLNHDGKLYDSPAGFRRKAERINGYLQRWGACGYRSGFMLRNLDWHHHLDVEYDATTFDTDPFEPQPQGAGTIFPFWYQRPTHFTPIPSRTSAPLNRGVSPNGHVALPYTLPQDSTLFLVLREPTPRIWLEKLDWVARQGGMALVNVHPDYLRFPDEPVSPSTFSSEHYATLLQHVREKHGSQVWHTLPHTVARWYRTQPQLRSELPRNPISAKVLTNGAKLAGRRAAVVVYSEYPSDTRVRRATEALVEAGMQVDLLGLSEAEAPAREVIGGVNVTRARIVRNRSGAIAYISNYLRFFWAAFCFVTWRAFRSRLDLVHVHNMPDFLVLATLLARLRGARVILDLHDPSPELTIAIFGVAPSHPLVRVMRLLERLSIAAAHRVLTPNLSFRNLFCSRGCPETKVEIMMNTPKEEIYDPARYPGVAAARTGDGTFRVMHHGTPVHRHGVDLLVEAVAMLRPRIPGLLLEIYGERTDFIPVVLARARELGVEDLVRYHGPKSQPEIAAAILACDVGVIPNRFSPFTNLNFPTRIFEYLALHRPVVAPDTRGIRDYFLEDQILFFAPENVHALAAQIERCHRDREGVREIVRRGHEVYRAHLWRDEKARYLGIVSDLVAR
jgi:glycosyltransferase involved in cell wall biosynthesis